MDHASDSTAQRDAEPHIIAAVSNHVGLPLASITVDLGDGVRVQLDGASEGYSVIVEAFARVGTVKSGQQRKMTSDAFKLVWVGKRLNAQRLIIAVSDQDVERFLTRPKAWLTAALADAGVEVLRVELDDDVTASIVSAQKLQYR